MITTKTEKPDAAAIAPGIEKTLEPLFNSVEDCREILPLVPLLAALGNGRLGWGELFGSKLLCHRPHLGPMIFLDCSSAKFVYDNGNEVPHRKLLVLVVEDFDLKEKLMTVFECTLQAYGHGYKPSENREKKSDAVAKQLGTAVKGITALFKLDPPEEK